MIAAPSVISTSDWPNKAKVRYSSERLGSYAFYMPVAEVEDELIGDVSVTQAVEGNPFSLPRLDRHTFKQGGKDSK